MKYLSIISLCLLFVSCDRGKLTNPNNNNGPLDYTLTGVHDVAVYQHDSIAMNVQLNYISGAKDIVGLTVSNLVPNYTLNFSPQLDTPTYASLLKIMTDGADTGIHSFQVLATGGGKTKSYNINVLVMKDTLNPAQHFVGNLYETGACTNSNPTNNLVTAYVPTHSAAKLHLTGIWLGGNTYELDMYFNSFFHTVSIPAQSSNGMTFTGSGTYTNTAIQLAYTVTGNFVSESCNVTLVK
jgi:hypothetical protein